MVMLPTFICIGALKCGTTSLAEWLRNHPDVFVPDLKEPRFFLYDASNPLHHNKSRETLPIRTIAEYEALFEPGRFSRVVGEASPQYLTSKYACRRISETIPNVALIAAIRHPVRRAYSQYSMRIRLGVEDRPFEEAVKSNEGWVRNSFYFDNLKGYIDRFGRSAIHVIIFERLILDEALELENLCAFLDIEYAKGLGRLPNENKGSQSSLPWIDRLTRSQRLRRLMRGVVPRQVVRSIRSFGPQVRNVLPMPDEEVAELMRSFRTDVDRTADLIGVDLCTIWGIS